MLSEMKRKTKKEKKKAIKGLKRLENVGISHPQSNVDYGQFQLEAI